MILNRDHRRDTEDEAQGRQARPKLVQQQTLEAESKPPLNPNKEGRKAGTASRSNDLPGFVRCLGAVQ